MIDYKKELEEAIVLLDRALDFIGYAECCGNKCRLPHCLSCYGDEAIEESGVEELEISAKNVIEKWRKAQYEV